MLNMNSRDLNVNACYENEEYNEFAGAVLELSVTGKNEYCYDAVQ